MMGLILKILLHINLCTGVLSVHQLSWLPCQFIDEKVTLSEDGQYKDIQPIHRKATLQFGQSGDFPVNPQAVTFLVTGGSKLDLRRYMDGAEAEQLECELHRYSTEGLHVRWPAQPQAYNRWFSCTIKHSKGLFTATAFLRHPSDQPPPGRPDRHSWPAIDDGEILTTTVAMVIKTLSPSVTAGLNSQQKLHCQFALDHRGSNVMVEWHYRYRMEPNRLFHYNSRSGKPEGSGVNMKSLAGGDISYVLPLAKVKNEGTYICSVTVDPLLVSLDVNLNIEEPPRVSINVDPTLVLQRGEEQKVICDADNYYPLDVDIVWYKQDLAVSGQSVHAPPPERLKNFHLSSHKYGNDMRSSLSASFYLRAQRSDSGAQFTCSVSHRSHKTPIRKSFILTVEEPWSLTIKLMAPAIMISVVGFGYLRLVRKKSVRRKPY